MSSAMSRIWLQKSPRDKEWAKVTPRFDADSFFFMCIWNIDLFLANLFWMLSIITGNDAVVSQYTDSLESQHAYIKEAVDITFPQNIRILQSVLDKVRDKIQRLEKAISAQKARCSAPCKVSCPIPVVSGKECEDIFRKGGEDSQMYLIRPDPLSMPYKVFCDQSTNNGGMVFFIAFMNHLSSQ